MGERLPEELRPGHVLERVQQLLESGALDVAEVRSRLSATDLVALQMNPSAEIEYSRETYDRFLALVVLAAGRIGLVKREDGEWHSEATGSVTHVDPRWDPEESAVTIRLLLVGFDLAARVRIVSGLKVARDVRFEVVEGSGDGGPDARLPEHDCDVVLVNAASGAGPGLGWLSATDVTTSAVPIVFAIDPADEAEVVRRGERRYVVDRDLDPRHLVWTLRTSVEHDDLQSQLENARKREQFFATRDGLTGLSNGFHFRERLRRAIHFAAQDGKQLAVLQLDLHRFKEINDTLGHDVGDSLLINMSERFQGLLGEADLIARSGGDQFLVLLRPVHDSEGPARTANRLLSSASIPFVVDGYEHGLSANVGIALYPRDGEDPETLVRAADAAMYEAKSLGPGGYRFFSRSINAAAARKLAVESRLRHALERGDLSLYYQPRVDGVTGAFLGAEALVRWTDEVIGSVPPGEFIPIAEERGLVTPIGRFALFTACAQLGEWLKEGLDIGKLSVNVSANQIRDDSLYNAVSRVLEETGVPPDRLEIEITESALIQNSEAAARVLAGVKQLGVSISLDDFGTGFSSLAYLKRFPVDTIKIDQSFVRDLPARGDEIPIVDAIISIAKTLNLRVVAEGVETTEQRAYLLSRGCVEMQGYLWSRAVPPDEFAALLRAAERD